jgi:hypothetical protein
VTRAKSDVQQITADLVSALRDIRRHVPTESEESLAHVETFCAIALRIMAKTNPSKLRDAAMTEEILARVQGREVIRDEPVP